MEPGMGAVETSSFTLSVMQCDGQASEIGQRTHAQVPGTELGAGTRATCGSGSESSIPRGTAVELAPDQPYLVSVLVLNESGESGVRIRCQFWFQEPVEPVSDAVRKGLA